MTKEETIQDEFGPEYRVSVYDPKSGTRGFLVIDNTRLGPGKGGIRMTPGVSLEEVGRLARTMTWKNALAGIPFGGAKAGLVIPPGTDETKKKELVQAFAKAVAPFIPKKYIAGPDVNSGEREMQWIAEALNRWNAATGKPKEYCDGKKCGLPHELGSTGFGVAHATRVAAEAAKIPLQGATISIHGFGNVATFAWQFLTEMGATVVALADRSATLYAANGFDKRTMQDFIKSGKKLNEFPARSEARSDGRPEGEKRAPDALWDIESDILIPASVTDVINNANKSRIKTKLIVEGGNIPMQESIEAEFHDRGIWIVPDFVANAGGVISSYAEYRGYSAEKMFKLVERKVVAATRAVMKRAVKEQRNPREIAMELARERVLKNTK